MRMRVVERCRVSGVCILRVYVVSLSRRVRSLAFLSASSNSLSQLAVKTCATCKMMVAERAVVCFNLINVSHGCCFLPFGVTPRLLPGTACHWPAALPSGTITPTSQTTTILTLPHIDRQHFALASSTACVPAQWQLKAPTVMRSSKTLTRTRRQLTPPPSTLPEAYSSIKSQTTRRHGRR
jgi:hypothetical protein